ncbi:MAG: YtxH domain-containing protein [Acidiferrobacter sp.]
MEMNAQYLPAASDRAGAKVMMFISGVALGYAVATLLAPKSGREIRSSLGEFAKSKGDSVSGAVRSAVGAARDATRNVSRRVADAMDEGREKAGDAVASAAAKVASASRGAE